MKRTDTNRLSGSSYPYFSALVSFSLCLLSFTPLSLSSLLPGHVGAGGGGDDGGVPVGRPPANPAVNHEQEPIAGGGKGSTLSAVHR